LKISDRTFEFKKMSSHETLELAFTNEAAN